MDYLILFLIVLGVNLMPAFGPPTWSILVLYTLNTDLPRGLVVITGAIAAALGRYLLARASRLVGRRLSARSRGNLEAARQALEGSKRSSILALGLFAVSPLPSAQLFEAAGLAGVRLLPFTAAFFAGRLVSYAFYAFSAAEIRESNIGEAFARQFTSPLGLALQIALIALVIGMTRVDWGRLIARRRGSSGGEGPAPAPSPPARRP
jgi:uncharacterized membrane protein YdjX (TVP38/TMEM64 family)